MGGFNLPPALMGLFTGDAPTFDQVMALAPQLDTMGGTNVFSQAFAQDNPDLITGDVMKQGSIAQATQANPLLTNDEIFQQANDKAKKDTFLGIGKNRKRRLNEQMLQQQNQNTANVNQAVGGINLGTNTMNLANASQLMELLGSWFGQQGGTPFDIVPTPAQPGPVQPGPAQPGQDRITLEEADKLTEDDAAFIKSLKDDREGRAKVALILQDMGFEGGVNAVKEYKKIQGLNVGPTKGADNRIDKGFLDYLSGHYKDFQYHEWGLDRKSKENSLQTGGKAIQGYSDNSPYKNAPSINIPGNNITMANTGMPLMGVPDVGEPRVMQPYSGTHIYPGASHVQEIPMGQMGGNLKGLKLVPSGTQDQVPVSYDVWKGNKFLGSYQDEGQGEFNFYRKTKGKSVLDTTFPKLVPDQDTSSDGLGVWQGGNKIGYFNPGKEKFSYEYKPLEKMATGGSIHIDPAKRGTFKAQATRMGMSVQEAAAHILANKDHYSPAMVKKANFARNFAHQYGGTIDPPEMPEEMKKGGRKKRMVPYYQTGGGDGQEGQQAPQEAPTPPVGVQLEVGEIFSTPELDLIDVNAREKHKNMEDDKITDVLRPNDYVFSNDPSIKVNRKRAEKVSFGLGAVHYKEGEIGDIPQEVTAADMMPDGVDEMILADYIKEVRKEFPMSPREDMFARKTNQANKSSRIPYMAAATLFNEEKRTKGKSPMTGFVSNFHNQFEEAYTSGSGVDMSGNQHVAFGEILPAQEVPNDQESMPENTAESQQGIQEGRKGGAMVPHGQLGLDSIGQLANFATSIYGIFANKANGQTARKALQADIPAIEKLYQSEGMHSDLAFGAQAAGIAGQDPTVNAPQYDSTQLDARPRNVSPAIFQLAAARAAAGDRPFLNAAVANAGDFSEVANTYSQVHAPSFGALADLGAQEVNTNLGLETAYRDQKQAFNDRQVLADTTAQNATRTNANQLTGALANTVSGGISSRGRIAANRINALRSNKLQQAQAKIDANAAVTGAIENAGASAANTGYALEVNGNGINNNVDVSGSKAMSFPMPPTPPGAYGMPGQIPDGYALIFKDGKYQYIQLPQ